MLNQLKNIGLSDNEAKVYLAMLELGPASVQELAAKAGINRPTAYFQIESLKKLGLVSVQNKGTKQFFVAESPEQLEALLDKQANQLEQKKKELKEVMPDLSTMFSLGDQKPVVRYFEGKEGLLSMQKILLKSKVKEILGMSSLDDLYQVFPKIKEDYVPERVRKKIKSRFIYTSSEGPILKSSDKQNLRESKFIPQDRMPFTADLTIFGDSVALASLKGNLTGIIIQHSEIAKSFKSLFEFTWNLAK
jgi:HTH-type transcriptional regulator, sugar sensing transcriptional regulator